MLIYDLVSRFKLLFLVTVFYAIDSDCIIPTIKGSYYYLFAILIIINKELGITLLKAFSQSLPDIQVGIKVRFQSNHVKA